MTPFAADLQRLCRNGDLLAAKMLLEARPELLAQAQQSPNDPASRLLLDHASYLRGWSTLQLRLNRIVGAGAPAITRDTPDLLLVSHPGDEFLRRWVGAAARLSHLTVDNFRTELEGDADPDADLTDALGLPLDRYVDQAIEAITAKAISLGAPLIVMHGQPWLAVAASAAAHRLGLPFWWDLRGDAPGIARIRGGVPYSTAVPSPPEDAAFRAAASAARLVVGDGEVASLSPVRELRDRMVVIGRGPHGAAPTFTDVWRAWRATRAGFVPSAPRQHFVGALQGASSVPFVPRVAVLGSLDGLPHDQVISDPVEILPEEFDAVMIDARTTDAWAAARERAIQARTYHLPIVAIGLPEPAERPFADIIATIGPVPREARTSGHQPQWGFVAISENPTGLRMAMRAASLTIGAPAFTPSPSSPTTSSEAVFAAPAQALSVYVLGNGDDDSLRVTLDSLADQTLHAKLHTSEALPPGAPVPPEGDGVVVVQTGEVLPTDFLLTRWLSGSDPLV